MSIWIISEFYDSYAGNTDGYYVKGIAEKLAMKKNVIVVFPYKKHLLNKNNNHGVTIHCVHPLNYNRDNLIYRLWGQLVMSLQFVFYLLMNIKKNDVIVCFTQPVFFVFGCSLLKKLINIKTFVVVYDLFPECLIGTEVINNNWFYRSVLKAYNKSYHGFDSIISIGNDMTQLLQTKISNNHSKIITIPHWTDVDEVFYQEKKHNEIIIKYNLESKIIFTYAGNLGRSQGIDKLLRLIEQIDSNNGIHFLFFGKGAVLNSFLQSINHNKNLITYAGYFPEKDKNMVLNACDIAIISLLEGMTGISVPSKTYNILASGHPILFVGGENSEIAMLIKRYDVGWVCNPADSVMFKKIVNEILSNPIDVKNKGEKARSLAESNFSKELILNQYMDVFEKFYDKMKLL